MSGRYSRWRRETGQVLVIFALALPVLLGLSAIVIDFGNLFVQKRSLQKAADAAALAAAQRLPGGSCDAACESEVAQLAGNFSDANLGYADGSPLPECSVVITSNCYELIDGGTRVRVRLSKEVSTFFGGLIGKGSYSVGAKATAGPLPYTTVTPGSTTVTPGQTIVNTTTTGGYAAAIFVRAQICSSFFFPGSNSGNVITGLATYGGVGSFGVGNTINGIRMNHYFYNQNGCSYPTSGAPQPPEFWQYTEPGHVPADGVGPDDWAVPYPDLTTLARDASTTCLYTSTSLTAKELTNGVATLTTIRPTCLHVGDLVTVDLVDNRFDCTSCAVTAASGTSFSYAKALTSFSRSVTAKSAKSGAATLTTSAAHTLNVGDKITVSGVDATFNGNYTVTAVPTTTTFSYAKVLPNVNLTVTTKAMTAGVATLTTSVAHQLSAGDSVTVDIGDARYDGTYTVASVPSATTFTYTPTPVTVTVTNKAISGGVATLTTNAAHGFVVGSTVTVAVNDPRFDGTATLTAKTSNTFSYTPATIPTTSWAIASNVATLTATSPPHGLQVGDTVTVGAFAGKNAPTYLVGGPYTVTAVSGSTFSFAFTSANANGNNDSTTTIVSVASSAASGTAAVSTLPSAAATGTVTVPGFVASTAVSPAGTVTFTGDVAPTALSGTNTATSGALVNATIASGWTATHPPGIYMVDAPYGTALSITAANTNFAGYTWVAPEISISGAGDTFTNFASAPQAAVFYAYDPNGDAVHQTAVSYITGSIFCGPPEPTTLNPNPTNKCWFGGSGTTFQGLLQAWRIEWKLSNAVFNGTGPIVQGTVSTSTTTTPGTTVIVPPVTNTVGTGSNLDE